MKISELKKYYGLDFSSDENKERFKQAYKTHSNSGMYNEQLKQVFYFLVRHLGVESKDLHALENYVHGTKYNYKNYVGQLIHRDDISMYGLDMFKDWNPDEPDSIIRCALNIQIRTKHIFDFCDVHQFYNKDNGSNLVSLLAEYDRFTDIDWFFFSSKNIVDQRLTDFAFETFKNSKYTDDGYTQQHKSMLPYLEQSGFEKYNFEELLLNLTPAKAEGAKFKTLYRLWTSKIEKSGSLANELDFKIFVTLLNTKANTPDEYKTIDSDKLLSGLKKADSEQLTRLFDVLDYRCLNMLVGEQWAIPVLQNNLTKINLDNAGIIRALSTNKLTKEPHYTGTNLKAVFVRGLHSDLNMMFFNLSRMLPDAVDGKPVDTPITRAGIALVLIHLENKGKIKDSVGKSLERVLPGITSENGRRKLIQHYFPGSNDILKLRSIYSDSELIASICMEDLDKNTVECNVSDIGLCG